MREIEWRLPHRNRPYGSRDLRGGGGRTAPPPPPVTSSRKPTSNRVNGKNNDGHKVQAAERHGTHFSLGMTLIMTSKVTCVGVSRKLSREDVKYKKDNQSLVRIRWKILEIFAKDRGGFLCTPYFSRDLKIYLTVFFYHFQCREGTSSSLHCQCREGTSTLP